MPPIATRWEIDVNLAPFLQLPLATQVHLGLAILALLLGPLALSAPKGGGRHRHLGQAWALAMVGAALTSLWIHDTRLPNWQGYTPIHLLVPLTLTGVGAGVWFALRHRIDAHRQAMWRTYLGACVGAGLFALAPNRFLGELLWHHALALV